MINDSKAYISTLKKERIDSLVIFLSLAFFMSQFYTWDSGTPQISHILILLAFILFVLKINLLKVSSAKILSLFMIYVLINNLVWFFINDFDQGYLNSIAYWIFNFAFYLLLINLRKEREKHLLSCLLKIITFSYVLSVVLWLLDLGRYDFYPRYNGFFNDPNQMAFWVLSTCSIYLYVSDKKYKNFIIYGLAVFLILLTLSRSALLGFPFLTIALIAKQKGSVVKKILLTFASSIFLSAILFILYNQGVFDGIISRLIEGIAEKDKQAEGRGFDILLDFPEHLIFGAGQGGYEIYSPTGHEIHSTWFGILFYYGTFGLILFLSFLYKIYRKLSFADKMLFLAPMIYGFTTYNARTTIFWFLIAVFFLKKDTSYYK